jgi:hypothetical protein
VNCFAPRRGESEPRRGLPKKIACMDAADPQFFFDDHRGARMHRFMESADVNAAFRTIFRCLRANIRRGMTIGGQVYGLEMDECIPGQVMGSVWIPPATRGVRDTWRLMLDATLRRGFFARLLAERRAEALFAFVYERRANIDGQRRAVLYVEVVSVDAVYAVEYPIQRGNGWHRRELVSASHRRLDPLAMA